MELCNDSSIWPRERRLRSSYSPTWIPEAPVIFPAALIPLTMGHCERGQACEFKSAVYFYYYLCMLLISCQGSAGVLRMTSNNRQHLFLPFCVTLCRNPVPLHLSPNLQDLHFHRCGQERQGERSMCLL